jgi:lauroyl/myristoyl acyltransferase
MPHTSVLSEQTNGPTPQDDGVRDARLLARLYASKHLHRLMPAFLAMAISAALGPHAGKRRNPAVERDAERFMKDLLLYTPRKDEAQALARRYRREHARMIELMWRPWLLKRSRVVGREHWDAAHAGEGGCVAVVGHMGGTFAVPGILARHGLYVHIVMNPHFWQPTGGIIGLAAVHIRKEYGEKALGSSRLIPSNAGPERLIELVESGETVVIAFDVPGSAATPFLGRSVVLGGGPATVAFRTGAKVLPMIPERHGTRIDLRMLEPLDPADYRDLRSLRAAIARTFEPLVLAKPEMVEIPWSSPPHPLVNEAMSAVPDEYAASVRRIQEAALTATPTAGTPTAPPDEVPK